MPDQRSRMTFAGRPFRLASEKVRTLVDRYQPLDHLRDLQFPDPSPNPRLNHLGVAAGPQIPPRLNDLFYPTGATRWACFRGLMTRTDLAPVLEACFGGGDSAAQPFLLEANGVTVTTDLFLLPPRPVAELGEDAAPDGLYLLTLVDERYFWQSRGAGKIRCSSGTATWAGLIGTIAAALGVTLGYAAVSADYGSPEPDSALYSSDESAAALLDAAAANVGCVVVRKFDGTYRLQRWGEANAAALAADAGSLAQARTAGGPVLPFDPAASSAARAGVLPRRVVVTFPRWVDGAGYEVPSPLYRGWELRSYHDVYALTVENSDLASPYPDLATYDAEVVLRTTAKARLTAAFDATPNNLTALTTLAEKLASDVYDRHLGSCDASFPGLFAADPLWGCDLLFAWTGGTARPKPYTRATRPPWNHAPREFQHGLGALAIPAASAPAVFFARLTTSSGGAWKWYKLKVNSSGVWADDGSESAAFNAYPSQYDATYSCLPFAGLRVWMKQSTSDSTKYEFLPVGYADVTHPGVVSTTTQGFGGHKSFVSLDSGYVIVNPTAAYGTIGSPFFYVLDPLVGFVIEVVPKRTNSGTVADMSYVRTGSGTAATVPSAESSLTPVWVGTTGGADCAHAFNGPAVVGNPLYQVDQGAGVAGSYSRRSISGGSLFSDYHRLKNPSSATVTTRTYTLNTATGAATFDVTGATNLTAFSVNSNVGATATVGGLSFVGGLYISGSLDLTGLTPDLSGLGGYSGTLNFLDGDGVTARSITTVNGLVTAMS